MASDAPVPEYPLPLARNTRVAVLGDDKMADALESAFRSTGRNVRRFPRHVEDAQVIKFAGVADIVFVTLAWDQLVGHLSELADSLADVVVAVLATSVSSDNDGYYMRHLDRGSVLETLADAWPQARLVGVLQQFGPQHLELASMGLLRSDVPVVGDDREATDLVEGVVDDLPGLETVFAGATRSASAVEGLTVLLREAERDLRKHVGFRLDEHHGLRILD